MNRKAPVQDAPRSGYELSRLRSRALVFEALGFMVVGRGIRGLVFEGLGFRVVGRGILGNFRV